MKNLFSIFAMLLLFSYFFKTQSQSIQVIATVDSVSCYGGSDGTVYLSISGGSIPQTSTKGLLISEFQADPTGSDSPFEFVELIATKNIDFSVTPYTVIFVNNGTATASGWIAGTNKTYAFQISSGTVSAGDVIYVGGSSMLPQSNRYRVIDTGVSAGDGGIGNADPSGVLGNGGTNADAIGVFNMAVNAITSSSVPIDAIFFGTAVGSALVSAGAAGYELPVNDHYSGGKLQSNSFLAINPTVSTFIKAEGTYDVATNTFSVPRVWSIVSNFTEMLSSVTLGGLYTYQWSNGATTQNLTGLVPGIYCYTVSDNNSSASNCVSVYEPDELSYQLYGLKNVTCYGANDGELWEYASGGTPPYTYSCSGGSMTNLGPGLYFVTVTDSKGCISAPYPAPITEPDELGFIPYTFSYVSCYGANDGAAVSYTATGGTPPYSYIWSGGRPDSLAPGYYEVTVVDSLGCTSSPYPFGINEPDSISFFSTVTDASSATSADGSISLQITGGTSPYDVLWSNNATDEVITGLLPGYYCATITDDNGCVADGCFDVDFTVGIGTNKNETIKIFAANKEIILSVAHNEPKNFSVEIYNMSGQLMSYDKIETASFTKNTGSWASGIYLVRVQAEGINMLKRVSVQ
jgi:hypothetical protein